jgi:1-aminocyclopropane-1-carboxylate deaminase
MIAGIDTLVDLQQAVVHELELPLLTPRKITAGVLRIDKIHATVSGNKWFKLKYSLQQAISLQKTAIITFGGAYSNHLVATAYACAQLGLQSIGVVRGEEAADPSPALQECSSLGMELHFMSRTDFREKENVYPEINERYPDAYLIEEGGCNPLGVKGAAEIMDFIPPNEYTHICCAMGTGTMMAGIVGAARTGERVEGFSALKIPDRDNNGLQQFIDDSTGQRKNYNIQYNYHFGGYARRTPQLFKFMNEFYASTGIPLDFVYTGKLMYGVLDQAAKGYFPGGSRLLIIHSGGLQGNRSLPKNTLAF